MKEIEPPTNIFFKIPEGIIDFSNIIMIYPTIEKGRAAMQALKQLGDTMFTVVKRSDNTISLHFYNGKNGGINYLTNQPLHMIDGLPQFLIADLGRAIYICNATLGDSKPIVDTKSVIALCGFARVDEKNFDYQMPEL